MSIKGKAPVQDVALGRRVSPNTWRDISTVSRSTRLVGRNAMI